RDDEPAGTRITHEAKCHRTLAPEFFVADLEVRYLDRQSGLFANGNALANRVGNLVTFVAHVRRIQTTVSRRHTRERHDLIRLGVSSGNVDKSGGESDGTVLHSLLDETLHLPQLFRRGRAITETHHFATD